MEGKKVNLYLGVLGPRLAVQLKNQGLKMSREKLNTNQALIDALNRVRINGIITFSEADRIYERLFKRIVNDCE